METRNCQNCKNDFTLEPDDFSFYEKMKVPAPHVCPNCRFRMRAVWRNEMSLYNRKCDITGESIISAYNPKSPYTVVSLDYYKSEDWDPRNFAMDYDFTVPFFDQFDILLKKVYKRALFPILSVGPNIDSDYVNFAGGCKNSYLVFNTAYVENVMFTKGVTNAKDSMDLYYNDQVENCYECINVSKSNGIKWGKNSVACIDCILIDSCRNCQNCFGSVNLQNQTYCFFNQKLTREEYEMKIAEYIGSHQKMEEAITLFMEHVKKYPKRATQNTNSIDCTGDYIFDSKNCKYCYETGLTEDSRYIFSARKTKDSIGSIGGIGATECLENMTPNHTSRAIGTVACENSKNIEYSFVLNNCSDCIGCDGLKNAQYCILNKQYTKDEYEKVREHIIKELTDKNINGLIIPKELSPFAYNETVGQDNKPLTKEEAILFGFRWEDNIQATKNKETINSEKIPDSIIDVTNIITNEILMCEECDRNYKITDQELLFYRRMILPIPHKCFFCRHKDRVSRRGSYNFIQSKCDKCKKDILSSFPIEREEIVYCETCYQQEVI